MDEDDIIVSREFVAMAELVTDEACNALDEVARLEAENQRLRRAAIEVVDSRGTVRLDEAIDALDAVLIGVVVGRRDTTAGPMETAWPPPVGSAVTYIDDDGVTRPGCTVRAHGQKGWTRGRIRLDNGNQGCDDFMNNGASFSAWATQREVRCG